MKQIRDGFSLVEVVIALGVISLALLILLALLPLALKTNHTSAEETRATCILTGVEADLRNSYPAANNGKSRYFGLPLPYMNDTYGRTVANPLITTNLVASIGLSENETTNSPAANPPPDYQVSVVYTWVPAANARSSVEAHLVVGWPCRNTVNAVALCAATNYSGFVESYVSFPAP